MKNYLLVLVFIISFLVLNAQDQIGSMAEKSPDNSFEIGIQYFHKENLQQAEVNFLKTLKNNPDHIDALKYLAEIAIAQKKIPIVEYYYSKVLELNTEDVDALISLGVIQLNTGNFEQAEIFLQRALENEPNNELALFNLGVLYGAAGKLSTATETLKKVISINPGNGKYYQTLGLYLLLQDRYSDAEAMFLKSLTLDQNLIDSRKGLVIIYQNQNKLTSSQKYIHDLEVLSPNLPSLNLLKAKQYYLNNEIEMAIDYAQQEIEENPLEPDAYYFLVGLYKIKGEDRKADALSIAAQKLNEMDNAKQLSKNKR